MRKWLALYSILTVTPAFAGVTSYDVLLRKALEVSPEVEAARLSISQAESRVKAGYGQLAPEVSVLVDRYLPYEDDSEGTSARVSARWTLFEGLSGWRAIKAADASASKARYEAVASRFAVTEALGHAYLAWQKAERKLNLLAEVRKARQKILDTVTAMVHRGERERNEPLAFENQLLESEEQIERARGELVSATAAINAIFEEPVLEEEGTPEAGFLFKESHCGQSVESLSRHYSLRVLDQDVTLNDLKVRDTYGSYAPVVALRADRSLDAISSEAYKDQSSLALVMTWTLFSGFSSGFERSIAAHEREKSKLEKEQGLASLRERHRRNCQTIAFAERRIKLSEQIETNYKTLLTTANAQYRRGEIAALTLVDQELRLVNAQLSLLDAQFTKQAALLDQKIIHEGVVE